MRSVAAGESTDARIRAAGLGHRFEGTAMLFCGLSFELATGDVVGVCGPSGCGKSTLLSILARWERPAAGSLSMTGVERIGWVFQNPYGAPRRTALDHVSYPLLATGMNRRAADAAARETLGLFGLTDAADRPFRALSGGEAQRLMLARAVAAAPDLLLVDEPTAQLDTATAQTVNATLGNIAASGAIVVIATHDPDTRAACRWAIDMPDYAPPAGHVPDNGSGEAQ